MYITIESREVNVKNPYYTPEVRNIESEFYSEVQKFVTIHDTQEDLRYFLAERVSFAGSMRHFFAEELFPKIKTTVEVNM
jgi:hypothetical protein